MNRLRIFTLLGWALAGAVEFEGRSTQELRENALVKKYYLGV